MKGRDKVYKVIQEIWYAVEKANSSRRTKRDRGEITERIFSLTSPDSRVGHGGGVR